MYACGSWFVGSEVGGFESQCRSLCGSHVRLTCVLVKLCPRGDHTSVLISKGRYSELLRSPNRTNDWVRFSYYLVMTSPYLLSTMTIKSRHRIGRRRSSHSAPRVHPDFFAPFPAFPPLLLIPHLISLFRIFSQLQESSNFKFCTQRDYVNFAPHI